MTDHRLIEDYIPIEAISTEARREKSIRKDRISALHQRPAMLPPVRERRGGLVGSNRDRSMPCTVWPVNTDPTHPCP